MALSRLRVSHSSLSAKEAINVETAFQELTKNALKKFEDEPRCGARSV